MKKIIFIVFASLVWVLGERGYAEEFESPFTEGRYWIFEVFRNDEPDKLPYTIMYADGDTIIDGRICKNMKELRSTSPESTEFELGVRVSSRYEERGCVSILLKDSFWENMGYEMYPGDYPWLRLCDMGLGTGDIFHYTVVKKTDYIFVRGVKRKRIITTYPDYPDSEHDRWVEGIGSLREWASAKGLITSNSPWYRFYECRQDGNVIFTYDDFFAPTYNVTGVDEVGGEMSPGLRLSVGMVCAETTDDAIVRLSIFSSDGSEVAVTEGVGSAIVPTSPLAPGMYVARAVCNNGSRTLKWMQNR